MLDNEITVFQVKRSGNDALHYVIKVSVNGRTDSNVERVALDAVMSFVDSAVPEDLVTVTEGALAEMRLEKILSLHDTEVFRVIP